MKNIVGITIAAYIIISYAKMIGDQKSQAIGLKTKPKF